VANALAAAQLHHRVQLSESLTPNFIAESNEEGFEELMDEFAPMPTPWRDSRQLMTL
jgi:hypothetical protein